MSKVSCSIITIGDEILFGHILDTNSKWLSQELNKVGVKILEKKSIGDDYDQINDSVKNSLSNYCLLYTSPSPRDKRQSRMPSSA